MMMFVSHFLIHSIQKMDAAFLLSSLNAKIEINKNTTTGISYRKPPRQGLKN